MGRTGEAELLELIGSIYEAALSPGMWPEALRRLSGVCEDRPLALLWYWQKPRRGPLDIKFAGFDPAFLEPYREYYGHLDPRSRIRWDVAPGTVRVLSGYDAKVTEFYEDWLRPQGIGPAAPVCSETHVVEDRFGRLAMYGRDGQPDPSPDTLHLLEHILPHLTRAVAISFRVGSGDLLSHAMDLLPIGLILLDNSGMAIGMNPEAERIVSAADGLTHRHQSLSASHPEDASELQKALGEAGGATAHQAMNGHGVLQLRRPSGRRPLQVIVLPGLCRTDSVPLLGSASTLLFVSDPEADLELDPNLLSRLHDLTSAEARLAARLVAGDSVVSAAERLGITENTARDRLKCIFDKTGARSQPALLRLLLSGVATLRRSSR